MLQKFRRHNRFFFRKYFPYNSNAIVSNEIIMELRRHTFFRFLFLCTRHGKTAAHQTVPNFKDVYGHNFVLNLLQFRSF